MDFDFLKMPFSGFLLQKEVINPKKMSSLLFTCATRQDRYLCSLMPYGKTVGDLGEPTTMLFRGDVKK
jgi:hypothetical protein